MPAGPVRAFKLVQAGEVQKTLISLILPLITEVAVWLPVVLANVGLSTVSHANSQAA